MQIVAKRSASFLALLSCSMLSLAAPGCETEGYESALDVTMRDTGPNVRGGYVDFGDFAAGTVCKTESFESLGAGSGPLRALVHVDHRGYAQEQDRDATTAWVRWLTEDEIKICVRETSHSFENGDGGSHIDGLGVNYRVFRQDSVTQASRASGRKNGRTMTGDARDCGWVDFGKDFGEVPELHATVFGANAADNTNVHPSGTNVMDRGVTVWMEKVESDRAKICARATSVDPGDDTELNYAIDWFAYLSGTNPQPGSVYDSGTWTPPGVDVHGWIDNGETCVPQTFATDFNTTPDVFVSIDHVAYSGHDAMTTWIEDLDTEGFDLCFSELATPGTPGSNDDSVHRADLRLTWTAIES
ncbi:hypothetical protein PPSIR1_00987 [Plesiocystis pacifica SIR-1]|uniref:Lipoprotein n=1 Tax=Plesiocystis pacifica SIR-1 TaxID=391625 RepID=A6GCD1_9BACT|nr:hypothetical protein [Plesiocystis pacifica]EDM76490.1 hypothetical protein PPSIR1_00987 [Plesiocystis pacifica SIR-1]